MTAFAAERGVMWLASANAHHQILIGLRRPFLLPTGDMQEPVNLLVPNAGLMGWTFAFLLGFGILLVGVPLYLLRRRVRAKRASDAITTRVATGSIGVLEAAVTQLQTDVAQLELAQDFTTQLLSSATAPLATDAQPSNLTPTANHLPHLSQAIRRNSER